MTESENWGLYVHVPFCIKKCLYCDFYSETNPALIDGYIEALEREMLLYQSLNICFNTVYFGGGTPSFLGGQRISRIMELVHRYFRISAGSEITIEANPGAVSPSDFRVFLDSGINRINFGIQSFNKRNLEILGRIHSADESAKALDLARDSGFRNIGLDIISAIPGQTLKELESDIHIAAKFRPEHISCYSLVYEKGTPIYNSMICGKVVPVDDAPAADMFLETGSILKSYGYRRYEISNFAGRKKDGGFFYSAHNMKYWSHIPYLGLGPSAHSFDGKKRWWNHRSIGLWTMDLNRAEKPVEEEETPDSEEMMTETVFLNLRTCFGLDMTRFRMKFGIDIEKSASEKIEFLEKEKFAFKKEGRLILTEKGMLVSDAVIKGVIECF